MIIQYITYDLRPGGRVVDFIRFYVRRFFNIVITRISSLTILLFASYVLTFAGTSKAVQVEIDQGIMPFQIPLIRGTWAVEQSWAVQD